MRQKSQERKERIKVQERENRKGERKKERKEAKKKDQEGGFLVLEVYRFRLLVGNEADSHTVLSRGSERILLVTLELRCDA